MEAVAKTDQRTHLRDLAISRSLLEVTHPDLVRQVDVLTEANARLKERARALTDRTRSLEASLESLDQGLCVCDARQQITAWNQAFVRHAACPPELLSSGAARLVDVLRALARAGSLGSGDPEQLAQVRLERFAASDRTVRERQVRRDGRIVELRSVPMPEGGLALTVTDVTERDRFANELQRSNREFEQFAAVASHDLQEPLRMVIGCCELLRRRYRGRLDADADQFIDDAVDGARRMHGLIQNLLAYSRAGFAHVALAPVPADQPLDAALGNLRTRLLDTDATIERQKLPTVRADRSQLMQLFQNLIANALQYRSGDPPRVRICAARDGKLWRFSLADNGIGIDPRSGERIFEVFKRLHDHGDHPGTGIGLAICKRIVERHGGQIWLDADYAGGSRFCFTLPGVIDDGG